MPMTSGKLLIFSVLRSVFVVDCQPVGLLSLYRLTRGDPIVRSYLGRCVDTVVLSISLKMALWRMFWPQGTRLRKRLPISRSNHCAIYFSINLTVKNSSVYSEMELRGDYLNQLRNKGISFRKDVRKEIKEYYLSPTFSHEMNCPYRTNNLS